MCFYILYKLGCFGCFGCTINFFIITTLFLRAKNCNQDFLLGCVGCSLFYFLEQLLVFKTRYLVTPVFLSFSPFSVSMYGKKREQVFQPAPRKYSFSFSTDRVFLSSVR